MVRISPMSFIPLRNSTCSQRHGKRNIRVGPAPAIRLERAPHHGNLSSANGTSESAPRARAIVAERPSPAQARRILSLETHSGRASATRRPPAAAAAAVHSVRTGQATNLALVPISLAWIPWNTPVAGD